MRKTRKSPSRTRDTRLSEQISKYDYKDALYFDFIINCGFIDY